MCFLSGRNGERLNNMRLIERANVYGGYGNYVRIRQNNQDSKSILTSNSIHSNYIKNGIKYIVFHMHLLPGRLVHKVFYWLNAL